MKLLCKIADSFIYVVSRMGVTGATGSLSQGIQGLVERVHTYSNGIPAAVGFGVSTRQHFLDVGSVAEGVVIGSQIVTTLANAPAGQGAQKVKEYCSEITGRKVGKHTVTNGILEAQEKERPIVNGHGEEKPVINGDIKSENDHGHNAGSVHVDGVVKQGRNGTGPGLATQLEALNMDGGEFPAVPSRFGEFGGQYVPESLMDCLAELEKGFNEAKEDPAFWEEYRSYYPFMGRESQFHLAQRLTEHAGGANIYLKREDLNHTVGYLLP